jgi:hypothetical protein
MNGSDIYQGLIKRGYNAAQAAALTGNILQESGGNPNAFNQKEGASGLLQWRLDRLQGLRDFAKAQGADPADAQTQLDYIGYEMGGSERRSSAGFRSAGDLESANSALRPYIRYGDDSSAARLANARGILAQAQPQSDAGAQPGPQASASPAAPAPAPRALPQASPPIFANAAPAQPGAAASASPSQSPSPSQPPGLLSSLASIASSLPRFVDPTITPSPIFAPQQRPIDLSGLRAALAARAPIFANSHSQ